MSKETTEEPERENVSVGIIMPISAQGNLSAAHFASVKGIIIKAVNSIESNDYNFLEPNIISASGTTDHITRQIVRNIFEKMDLIIVDTSTNNGNVLFELGLRFAANKPVVLISDDQTKSIFDISEIRYTPYPVNLNYDDIVSFQQELGKIVERTYSESKNNSDFSQFLVPYAGVSVNDPVTLPEQKKVDTVELLQNIADKQDQLNSRLLQVEQSRNTTPYINPDTSYATPDLSSLILDNAKVKPLSTAAIDKLANLNHSILPDDSLLNKGVLDKPWSNPS